MEITISEHIMVYYRILLPTSNYEIYSHAEFGTTFYGCELLELFCGDFSTLLNLLKYVFSQNV